jgi:hypothetical protein
VVALVGTCIRCLLDGVIENGLAQLAIRPLGQLDLARVQ